jgi:hypothetical protein
MAVPELSALGNQVVSKIASELARSGWKKINEEQPGFENREYGEVVYQLGLNVKSREREVQLFPALGVRHPETSRLVLQFKRGRHVGESYACSVGASLIDLMEQSGHDLGNKMTRWIAFDYGEVEKMASDFLEDFNRWAMDFFRAHSTLESVVSELAHAKRNQTTTSHLAVLYALMGNRREARKARDYYVTASRGQVPPLLTQSQNFIRSFDSYFTLEPYIADGQ